MRKKITPKLGSGVWTFRSLLNNLDLTATFNSLEFGRGNLQITTTEDGSLVCKIIDSGWELKLKEYYHYENPACLWFQGTGMIGGSIWVYDYFCYVVPQTPNNKNKIQHWSEALPEQLLIKMVNETQVVQV